MAVRRAPPPLRAFALGFLLFVLFVGRPRAQAPAPGSAALEPRTIPLEVRSLNSIFRQWRLTAPPSSWNLTGDPCTGTAVDSTDIKDPNVNPALKCDCNQTTCHITQLRVYALDVVGRIPDELSNLKHLIVLNLMLNYLTGPLPAFIGNLTSMQWLVVGYNALSGPVPKELGNLQELVILGMGRNNFSGTLPPELGNITSLEQWYVDSCGLSGEIPASLSKLKNLQLFWASDNHFTGKIPDFIGAWTNLTDLRLQGNSFEGPIPSALASLTKLSDLRIGEIENGSSSLDFVQNMTSLTTLSYSVQLQAVFKLASFGFELQQYNGQTSSIPLQFKSTLTFVRNQYPKFLGNNSLIGSLPAQKSPSLLNIDLSYNELSGLFPSWVSDERLQLNLVFNNFVIGDSNSSVLPSGLNCLQRDIPCNRLSPIYSSFGIKCGGSRTITSSDGTVFEIDDKNLTTASYYVTDTKKWAVSNVGRFIDASTPAYRWSILNQFTNTLDSELFQTARLSPSSLRYYGLGLQNGNYTIKLQFAETAYPDTPLSWRTAGNRIFDIYIQGRCREKDFNIRKTAGGSYRAVMRDYIALVTDNFLEIHFFWAGKGTCCTPTQGYYGPAISAISISPSDFTPIVSNQPQSTSLTKKNTGLILVIAAGVAAVCIFFISGILWWKAGRKGLSLDDDDEERLDLSLRATEDFSYAELKAATEDFNPNNKLGQGGFGSVFKGTLSDGRAVAVKQLSVASHQGKRQFVTEIDTISAVQHRSLVKLYGCCVEGDKRLLVYEYLENKSLDQALFGEKKLQLDWSTRFGICLGTARGLAYLHEESRVRIVHRDVKASNILLDCDLKPKISDFGLAKLYDDTKTHISTRVAGTVGYLAPEYAMRGHLTEKADVFSFGIVALEIISGRPNLDASLPQEKIYLLEWSWYLHENKCELEMVEPAMTKYNKEEALRVIGVSLLCTQSSPVLRPAMSRVVAMLVGDMEVSDVTSRPTYLTDWHFKDLSTTFTNTHNVAEASSLPVGASHVNVSSSSTGSALGSCPSPMASQPMLLEVIREGGDHEHPTVNLS